jgi:hypothetical protein
MLAGPLHRRRQILHHRVVVAIWPFKLLLVRRVEQLK